MSVREALEQLLLAPTRLGGATRLLLGEERLAGLRTARGGMAPIGQLLTRSYATLRDSTPARRSVACWRRPRHGLRVVLRARDDYASLSKPEIEWDHPGSRRALIHSRAKDGFACLAIFDGAEVDAEVAGAGELLPMALGQDLELSDDGMFRIAKRVDTDSEISWCEQLSLNSSSDTRLLPSLLSAASEAASVSADAYMRADVESAGIEPLLAGGVLERT